MTRLDSDVSAVVLTVGEATTPAAIGSVEAQTLPAREIVLVEHVTPFSRALNEGASRVVTPFFVQVDADMILDPICFETLRRNMTPGVGQVSGFLRDRLLGRICCIKMFRTACLQQCPMPDTVAADVDFLHGITDLGWCLVIALRFDRPRDEWHTYAEHRRDYSPQYTFHKFQLEGRKARYRRDTFGFKDRLMRLHRRPQDVTVVAQIGLAHGVFNQDTGDGLRPFGESAEWRRLEAFLSADGGGRRVPVLRPTGDAKEIFRAAYRLGIELGAAQDASGFRCELRALGEASSAWGWIAQVGLCHGLFATDYGEDLFEDRFRLLSELLHAG
ncbi:MAG: glycosyltransferase family 2 protein [Candidatus Binatia bacterium]